MSPSTNRRLRRAYLISSYLFAVMAVVHAVLVRQQNPAEVFVSITLVTMITMTCAYDAAVRGRPWAMGERFSFAAFWPVALPGYVIYSRGWWGSALLLIHVAVLTLLACAIAIVTVVLRGGPGPG